MSFKILEVNKDEFSAVIGTLFCDKTNLKMAEVIIRAADKENYIEARWEDEKEPSSGTHLVKGNLSCSPIDTFTQKTAIIKSVVLNRDGKNISRLIVKKL